MLTNIFAKIDAEQDLNRDDITALLQVDDEAALEELYQRADRIREAYVGSEVHLRGLIEFSNYCRKNCNYCGIRAGNSKLQRYRMQAGEIVEVAVEAERLGYRTVVLQSGEDPFYKVERMEAIVRAIKQQTDLAITLSIGERPRKDYEQLYAAGADRYLLRFETSNSELYARLHPDSDYAQRMNTLHWLKEIGYQVGSGIMIGVPGQKLEDLADDILAFKKLDLDMIGVGPYICHKDTPLAGSANGTAEMTFKVIALSRIVTKNTYIPATTALASLRPSDGREKALELGANVVMPNMTPVHYRALYELYPAKVCIGENAQQCRGCMQGRIYSLGRPISRGHGHIPKKSCSV